MSSLFGSLDTTKLDKVDVVDPSTATEDGKAADAKKTQKELNRISGMASDALVLAESKADLVGGKVPAAQLPSYVDDVLEYDTKSAFPATGEEGKIYVAKDANKTYRWGGTQYVEISLSPVLDDTVTEESPNGVKSSGIWSWVKSLLPKWLTSDYAEPATVASVTGKANKAAPSAAGNLATLTADGNLADSGKTVDDFLPRVSNEPVRSTFDIHSPLLMTMDGYIQLERHGFIYGSFNNIREAGDSPISLRTELDSKADSSMISATNPTFSNAVLAVGLNIDTKSVSVLNEIAATFGDFPIEGTATTVGGLLAALAAAAAWLKKNKVGSFASVGDATATVENGVAKLDNFFTSSNSLLNGRLAYERNATGLKDRAFNALTFDGTEYNLSTALAAVTPTASGQPRDLLIVATATAATTISFTAGTIKGDKPTIDGAGTWLITLTEYEANTWYCRQIKMEDAA